MNLNNIYSINVLGRIFLSLVLLTTSSCSTLSSSWNSVSESVSDAGDYIYDSVIFWGDEEPEEDQAIIVEDAYEVPEFAVQEQPIQDFNNQYIPQNNMPQSYMPQPYIPQSPSFQYGDPIYRSARQYYNVSPNGSPMPAPPPPPFPQYSIDQNSSQYSRPYSITPFENYQNLGNNSSRPNQYDYIDNQRPQSNTRKMSEEEEMELYGIENDCIKVVNDYMNGGYKCDDLD